MLKENIQLAIEGLMANKMRALLTMLGIIIGIGSVIAIVTVGDSMTSSVSSSMESLGATNIIVNIQKRDTEDMHPMMSSASDVTENDLITDEMIEKYKEIYGNQIQAVGLSDSGISGKAQDGKRYANVTLTGTNEDYLLSGNVKMLDGRFLREGDIKSKRFVAVVSDKLVKNMFQSGKEALGKEIKVNAADNIQTYTIIGIYKHEDLIPMMSGAGVAEKDVRTALYLPISTSKMINSADDGYSFITVTAKSEVDTEKFTQQTTEFFNTYYKDNTKYEVGATNMESIMAEMTSMMGTLSLAVAVIAGISLLVGGVGVMNIMLVSVTERTREIGTRKALGARSSSIRVQFIVEAVIICAIGGIIGILTGIITGYTGASLLGFPALPSPDIMVIAFLFSMMIGIFFGYYPANKAAILDPIEALRYE